MAVPSIDVEGQVVTVTFGDTLSETDVREFIFEMRRFYEAKKPFVTIVDGRRAQFWGNNASKVRKLLAEGLNELVAQHPNVKVGEALIFSDSSGRAAETAVALMRERPFKVMHFANRVDAAQWALELLGSNKTMTAGYR